MATSNSTGYSVNATELITSAFEILGVAKAGEPLQPEDEAAATVVLNMMLKAFQKKLNLWKRKTASITLITDKVVYTIGQKSAGDTDTDQLSSNLTDNSANFTKDNVQVGDSVKNLVSGATATVTAVTSSTTVSISPIIFGSAPIAYSISDADVNAVRPMQILECNRKGSSGDEVTMNMLTRNEYENLPNKTAQGAPISYHYDPTISNGTFYIWQAPGATDAVEWTVELVFQATIEDVLTGSDDIDVPSEMYEALTVNLAYRLSSRFGGLNASERQMLRMDAMEAIDLAEGYDMEAGNVWIAPDIRDY